MPVERMARILAATHFGDTQERRNKVAWADLILSGFEVRHAGRSDETARDQLIGRMIDAMSPAYAVAPEDIGRERHAD